MSAPEPTTVSTPPQPAPVLPPPAPPRRWSGWSDDLATRAEVHRMLLLTGAYLLLAVPIALVWAYLAAPSREYTTDFGTLPANAQDEARVSGELWLMLALVVLAVGVTALWWLRGPRRGPVALVALTVSVAIGSALAGWIGSAVSGSRGSVPEQVGKLYDLPAGVHTPAVALAPALVAAACYCLAVIVHPDPSLRSRRPRHSRR